MKPTIEQLRQAWYIVCKMRQNSRARRACWIGEHDEDRMVEKLADLSTEWDMLLGELYALVDGAKLEEPT